MYVFSVAHACLAAETRHLAEWQYRWAPPLRSGFLCPAVGILAAFFAAIFFSAFRQKIVAAPGAGVFFCLDCMPARHFSAAARWAIFTCVIFGGKLFVTSGTCQISYHSVIPPKVILSESEYVIISAAYLLHRGCASLFRKRSDRQFSTIRRNIAYMQYLLFSCERNLLKKTQYKICTEKAKILSFRLQLLPKTAIRVKIT